MHTTGVNYHYLPTHHVHEFTFFRATRQTVDEAFDQMDKIYATLTENDQANILLDVRISGTLPFNYNFQRARTWIKQLDIHPTARLVFLHKPEPLTSIGQMFFQTLRLGHLTVHFITERDGAYNDALSWLTQKQIER